LVLIKNITISYDKKYVKELSFNQTVENGRSMFNAVIDTRYVITKLIGYVKVRIAENREDRNFKREFLRLAVDVEKLLSGQANFLMKIVAKTVLDSCDRTVQFPLAKVSSSLMADCCDLSAHQGAYRFTNLTFYDDFVPDVYYFVTFQALVDVKVVGRIKGGKSNVQLGNGYGRVEFSPNDRSKARNMTSAEFDKIVQLATSYFVRTKNSWEGS
jgi:hypothetical protein